MDPNDSPSQSAGIDHAVQRISVESGYGYGVVGADLHILGDGRPLYVLTNYASPKMPDRSWLRQLPSRMLNAQHAVVPFTGREIELASLIDWATAGPRLAAQWVYGPGGRGKTRLAHKVAEQLRAVGWKVIVATQGTGAVLPLPGSEDLRIGDSTGVLLIVDYADRWPLSHLGWLLSNSILGHLVKTRVLLLARAGTSWPAVRSLIETRQAETSAEVLPPLLNDSHQREQMLLAAQHSFSAVYGIDAAPLVAHSIGSLEGPQWDLTLSLHLAALVRVDAHVYGRTVPYDVRALTGYVLDREAQHWVRMYEHRVHGLAYSTPPVVMRKAVFTANLSGPHSYSVGKTIVSTLDMGLAADIILIDHASCYPPSNSSRDTVLDPLYPDRLAEDFLALTLGNVAVDHRQPWALSVADTLLRRRQDGTPPPWISRAVTFLAASAQRSPHVAQELLYPVLRTDPRLAIDAGSAALVTIVSIPECDLEVLERIAEHFPPRRHADLDVGIAAVMSLLTQYWIEQTADRQEQGRLLNYLSFRLMNAGDTKGALEAVDSAIQLLRGESNPSRATSGLAGALTNRGLYLRQLGRLDESLAATSEAVGIYRRLSRRSTFSKANLAAALDNVGNCLAAMGRREEAMSSTQESVSLYRELAASNYKRHASDLAAALHNLGSRHADVHRENDALSALVEASRIRKRLADEDPERFLPDYAETLGNMAARLYHCGKVSSAAKGAEVSMVYLRRLDSKNSAAFRPSLGIALRNLGLYLFELGRIEDALPVFTEVLDIYRSLSVANPARHLYDLASVLMNHSNLLGKLGLKEEGLSAADEAVAISRLLADSDLRAYGDGLGLCLVAFGARLAEVGRVEEGYNACCEAVDLYHRLPSVGGAMDLSSLAVAQVNLSYRLSEMGRHADACDFLSKAIALFRALCSPTSDAFLVQLASTLGRLGKELNELDRHEESVRVLEEVVELYRRLALIEPLLHEPSLAGFTGSLSVRIAGMGRLQEGLVLQEECVRISRRLVERDPERFSGDLAFRLYNLAALKWQADLRQEAIPHSLGAIILRKEMLTRHWEEPVAYELMDSLKNMANMFRQIGDLMGGLQARSEIVDLCRSIGEQGHGVDVPRQLLATLEALHNLRVAMSEAGREDDPEMAQLALEQAAAYGSLAERSLLPEDFDTATTIHNLAVELNNGSRPAEALVMEEMAVALYGTILAKEGRLAFELGRAMANLGRLRSSLGLYTEAYDTARKAVQYCERLVLGDTELEAELATAHWCLAIVCVEGKSHLLEARSSMELCVNTYRRLSLSMPDEYANRLVSATADLGEVIDLLGES